MKNLKEMPIANYRDEENSFSRKDFLKICGVTAAGATIGLSGCTEVPNAVDTTPPLELGPDPNPEDNNIWIGNDDIGLMNTIHINSRMQAAFFERVLGEPYEGMTVKEEQILTDIKRHKIAHSDFWGAFLQQNAIEDIHFTFENIDFTNRSEVLNTGFDFANISTGTFNCFPPMLTRDNLFALFIKIASVEARHALSLKFLLDPSKVFISNEIINVEYGFDAFINPQIAWSTFRRYIVESFDISGLPHQQF